MPDEDHLELEPLQLVRCLDHHSGKTTGVEDRSQKVFLIVVRDAHRNLLGPQGGWRRQPLAAYLRAALEESAHEVSEQADRFGVGREHRRAWQLDVCPSFAGGE